MPETAANNGTNGKGSNLTASSVPQTLSAHCGQRTEGENEKIISIDNMLYVYGSRKHFCRAIAKAYIGIRT